MAAGLTPSVPPLPASRATELQTELPIVLDVVQDLVARVLLRGPEHEMNGIVLYGVGSPVVVDVEESLARLGIPILAAVRNVPAEPRLLDTGPLIDLADVTAELRAQPFLVPLFTPAHRWRAVREALDLGFVSAASLVDPTVVRARDLTHGQGLYINAGCTLGAASQLGEFVFINRGATVGHHARVGPYASIGPGVVIAGQVSIGRGALIGAGAVVLPGVTIGDHAVVGAGAVVTSDVAARSLAVGNPARIVKGGLPCCDDQDVA